MRLPSFSSVAATSLVALCGMVSQLPAEQANSSGKPLDATDTKFAILASQDGQTEAKLGELAMKNGASQGVKAFGSMMATDHTKANVELSALCARRGVKLPSALDPDHQKMVDTLAALKGPDFDGPYVNQMITARKAAIAEFEGAAKTTKDAELKSFIEATLPTLRHHLQEAQALKVAAK
jgi:putative membrane protein